MKILKLTVRDLLLSSDCIVFSYTQLSELDLDSVTGTKSDERKAMRIFIAESIINNIHRGLDFEVVLHCNAHQLNVLKSYVMQGGFWFHKEIARGNIDDVKRIENKIDMLL